MERKNGGTKQWKKERREERAKTERKKGVGKESGRTCVQIAGRGKQATGRWFTHQVGMARVRIHATVEQKCKKTNTNKLKQDEKLATLHSH